MNNRTVVLEHDRWMDCWNEMCNELGYYPSWCDYPEYFNCVSCNPTDYQIHGHDEGLEIVFKNVTDAMAFKLRWI